MVTRLEALIPHSDPADSKNEDEAGNKSKPPPKKQKDEKTSEMRVKVVDNVFSHGLYREQAVNWSPTQHQPLNLGMDT